MEVVYGYMRLAILLKKKRKLHGEAFNFGPSLNQRLKVIEVIRRMKSNWKKISWQIVKNKNKSFYESKLLFLNSKKAKKYLKWSCILNSNETVKLVSEWYKLYYSNSKRPLNFTLNQIDHYEKLLKLKKR